MKVKPPVDAARPKPESKTRPAKKAAPFAKLLEQKEQAPLPPPQLFPLQRQVEESTAPVAARPTERIAELANEIGAKLEAGVAGTVTISFDSRTFDGLQVQISREQGQLAVRMISQTPEVAQILTSNVENLRQRLEERGYRKAIVQVQRAPRAATLPKEKKAWQ